MFSNALLTITAGMIPNFASPRNSLMWAKQDRVTVRS